MLSAIPFFTLGAGDQGLLSNPGFASGLQGWSASSDKVLMEAVFADGRTAAQITVPADAPVGYPCLYQEVPARPRELFEARVEAMARQVRDGYGVYAAIEFYDGNGKRLSFSQSEPVYFDSKWTGLNIRAFAPPDAVKARLCLILHGRGEAYFDSASLVRLGEVSAKPLDGPVTLTITRKVVCNSLIGFGAEDDGWFYGPENAAHGITDEDIALREGRVEWMNPDWVRMFFWYTDWCPSGDWKTFSFDSPNMQSHYRTLDLYQRIGARVNVTGVEWGMPDPYGQPERVAHAIGALFEHVIRTKGYTCVRDWTLTNEPNGAFMQMRYPFDRYVEIHRLVKQEFARRGLSVSIVGSDDTRGLPWFAQCVKDDAYFQTADLFCSHCYLQYGDTFLGPFFFDDRLSLLAKRKPRKPFIVGEFGFQDARSGTLENPLMETYPYAVWTAAFVIEGLNRGVAGFSMWCLHEVYYPGGGFMNYGLWDFKDNSWKPRPAYHAWANFCRLTEAGDNVRRCESSHPDHVLGALVGKTLFWVNRSDQPAEVRISGFKPAQARIMTESTLEGDRECGTLQKIEHNRFTAPPQSFGYAR